MKKLGFTLIELLIVITIIGILLALIVTNLAGARSRASDAKKKGNLRDLQYALQLYANNFGHYPNDSRNNGFNFYACGDAGNELCTSSFIAKNITYSSRLPKNSGGQNEFRYYPCNSGESYRLKINLDNASDPEISESQNRCPAGCGAANWGTTDYVLCAE